MKLIPPPASMRLGTGPVDGAEDQDCDESCPTCGADLTVTPAQKGICHGGLFATELFVDLYWCDECEEAFIDEADALDTVANARRKNKVARQVAE